MFFFVIMFFSSGYGVDTSDGTKREFIVVRDRVSVASKAVNL